MQHQDQLSENGYETYPEEESEKPSNSMVCFFSSFLANLLLSLLYVANCIAKSSLLVFTNNNYQQSPVYINVIYYNCTFLIYEICLSIICIRNK